MFVCFYFITDFKLIIVVAVSNYSFQLPWCQFHAMALFPARLVAALSHDCFII